MIYVSQIIMQYTLNLYSAVCQLYLSKTEKEVGDKCYEKIKSGWRRWNGKVVRFYLYMVVSKVLSDMTFVLRPEGRKTRTLKTNSSQALRYVYSENFCILTM